MKMSHTLNTIAAALATTFLMQGASAQTATDKTAVLSGMGMNSSDRAQMKTWNGERDKLAQTLKAGASKDDYRKILADQGYTITAINTDTVDYAEYEVVKGNQSYEVQIDMDKKTRMGSKVEVERNQWRADATKDAMRTGKPVLASTRLANGGTYSDRANNKGWSDQKTMLEKGLVPGNTLAFYTGMLTNMGYQVTSTNDKEKDYVELEIVKGRDSYEVQMDMDGAGKASKVDVTSNMWQSDATEKALSRKK
jgi:uncharacterized protein YmfQ (DUF2313 family)